MCTAHMCASFCWRVQCWFWTCQFRSNIRRYHSRISPGPVRKWILFFWKCGSEVFQWRVKRRRWKSNNPSSRPSIAGSACKDCLSELCLTVITIDVARNNFTPLCSRDKTNEVAKFVPKIGNEPVGNIARSRRNLSWVTACQVGWRTLLSRHKRSQSRAKEPSPPPGYAQLNYSVLQI